MTLALSPDALVSGDGDECYLTDLATGNVFRVNATARRIVEGIRDGRSPGSIVDLLVAAHPDVAREEIARDVQDLVAELTTAGLVGTRDTPR